MDELRKASILTKEKTIKLKEYISKKYPHNTETANASVLSKVIHEIIDKSLEGLESPYNSKIRSLVIKNSFMNDDKDILKIHIVEAAIPFAERDLEFKKKLIKWINSNQKTMLSEIEFDRNILRKNTNDNTVSSELCVEHSSNNHIPNYVSSKDISKKNLKEQRKYSHLINNLISINKIDIKKINHYKNKVVSLICRYKSIFTKDKIKDLTSIKNLRGIKILASIKKLRDIEFLSNLKNFSNISSSVNTKVVTTILRKVPYSKVNKNIFMCLIALILLLTASISSLFIINKNKAINDVNNYKSKEVPVFNSSVAYSENITILNRMSYHPHLPEYFNYKNINIQKLKGYLNKRNSILVDEPYFSAIIDISKEFNLNPLILFAITGQEQGFVSRDNDSAEKIANNPFNVFHSWQEYNTNIKDSSRIAARTVINLALDRPSYIDPFSWINKGYAEDKNWSKGVKDLYEELVNATK